MTELVLEEVIAKEAEIFEDRVDFADHMENLLIVATLECLIDVEVDIPHEVIERLCVLVDQLFIGLQQQILAFLLLLQQIHDHDSLKFTLDVPEVLQEGQGRQLLIASQADFVPLGFLLPEEWSTA